MRTNKTYPGSTLLKLKSVPVDLIFEIIGWLIADGAFAFIVYLTCNRGTPYVMSTFSIVGLIILVLTSIYKVTADLKNSRERHY